MPKARDIMTKNVVTVAPETEILQAARLLLDNHFNGLPVVDHEGNIKGILRQDDLVAQQKKLPVPSFFALLDGLIPLKSQKSIERELEKITAVTVEEAMTTYFVTVSPDTDVEDIASIMVNERVQTVPVVHEGRLVGVVGKEDILRMMVPQEP